MGRRPRHILLRMLLGAGLALSLFLFAAFGLLPFLASRGDLNRIVEGVLQSLISVPVRIESIETDPLSEFSITRISSLSSEEENRFQFLCARVTAFYSPLELVFQNRLRELTVQGPSLFLNLDEDLSGLLHLGGTAGTGSGSFLVDRFRISDGRLRVRLGGRDLVMEDLDLDAMGIGGGGDMSFRLGARGLGARLSGEGRLARMGNTPDSPPRYRILSARLDLEGLDLEPLVPFLAPAGLSGGGLFSLSGTAEGIWPDRVDARLSSQLSEARVTPDGGPRLLGGEGRLEVEVTELEGRQLDFHARLDTEAQVDERAGGPPAPIHERLSFIARGHLEMGGPGEGGALLRLDEAILEVPAIGELKAEGTIGLKGPEPTFALDLRAPGISLGRLGSHALGAPLRGILAQAQGVLDLEVHASGTRKSPQLLARFDLKDGVIGSADHPLLKTSLSGEAGFRGKLAPKERTSEPGAGPLEGDLDFKVSRGSLSVPGAELEAPDFSASGSASLALDPENEARLRFGAKLSAKELGLGPAVEEAVEEPIEVGGEAVFRAPPGQGPVEVDFDLRTPSTGTVLVRGTIAPAAQGSPDLDLEVRADSLPTSRFLKTYLADPFREKAPILEGARFTGNSRLRGRVRGPASGLRVEGMVQTDGLGVKLAGGTEIESLDLALPFRIGGGAGEPATPGSLRIGRLSVGGLDLREVQVPFELAGGTYRVLEGVVRIPLFGGELDLERLQLSPFSPGERVRLQFTARELKLEEITRVLGFEEIPGRILFEVGSLTMAGDRLKIDGRLALDVFGGSLMLEGLSIEHPFSPYRAFRLASGTLRDFHLERLGRQFRFGVASGVLEGRIVDLEILGTEIAGFEAEFETVPRPGVPQYLNKAAIESIQRIFAGPFGGIEEVFFSRFRYAGFGFSASVKDGGLRLSGKYRFGGTEYLMYASWYQLPKVSIINTHPGIVYDWEWIKENLRSIYHRQE